MMGPQFPIYQKVRRRGFLIPNENGYEKYAQLHNKLGADHPFHGSNPLMNPPYVTEELITEGGKYLTIQHIHPTLPPVYVGQMWDEIPKEWFNEAWWQSGEAVAMFEHLPFKEMWIEFDEPNITPEIGGPDRIPMGCTFHVVGADNEMKVPFVVVTVFMLDNSIPTKDEDTGRYTDMLLPMAVGGFPLDPANPQRPRVGWTPYHWGLGIDCILDGLNIAAMLARFLNCRNVELVEVLPRTIAENPKKRRKRLSDPSRTKYRVVHVEPVKRRQRQQGAPGAPGPARRQHLRRGHFKTYGPEAPLFGTLTGTWWWGPAIYGEGGELDQKWDMSSLIVKPEEVKDDAT